MPIFEVKKGCSVCLVCLFVCFVLRHIKLIGHLMPHQVKEDKSEKKFKGEVFGIKDKLKITSWLFVFCFVLLGVYLFGLVWFLYLMAYQFFLGYLMPKPFS